MRAHRFRHCPSRRLVMRAALAGVAAASVGGCAPGRNSGPVEIKWDRDVCTHCGMAISDRRFAAQVRGGPRRAVHKFDDIGCAIVWLEKQPWRGEPATELWVAAHDSGRWLDARAASYLAGRTSPMGYNYAAGEPGAAGGVDFAQARAAILELERKARSRAPGGLTP